MKQFLFVLSCLPSGWEDFGVRFKEKNKKKK